MSLSKDNNFMIKDLTIIEQDEISNNGQQRKMIKKIKEDMYKHLNEFKNDINEEEN
jgi:hypothetical protein